MVMAATRDYISSIDVAKLGFLETFVLPISPTVVVFAAEAKLDVGPGCYLGYFLIYFVSGPGLPSECARGKIFIHLLTID